MKIRPVAVSEFDYREFMEKHESALSDHRARVGSGKSSPPGARWRELAVLDSPVGAVDEKSTTVGIKGRDVVALLNQLLAEAVDLGASDLHLDPDKHGGTVRYRVDGKLVKRENPIPEAYYRALLSRVKVVSGMDIADKRRPQDGRFSIEYMGGMFDIRVATMPALMGERAALRILDARSAHMELSELVLARELVEIIRRMISSPIGAVLVTGPTGSGKTTTLYSLMKERLRLNEDINVVTVEDPIEYRVPGIAQVQVDEASGLSFPVVLRGLLRHDPDVIMVGETRDEVTARIAMEAALTGHLVLTSMHTNDALGSITRLKEMGVPSFMIANSLAGVIAQRLVRRCCPVCSEPHNYSGTVLDNLRHAGVIGNEEFTMVAARGCSSCGGTGFKGRVGVYEVLQVAGVLRNLIAESASMKELEREAEEHGMVTLRTYSRFLLRSHLTVPGEVLAILASED